MSKYEYRAIKVVQQPNAPAFFITSAPAAELLEWCDVPRAKGDYMAGYQRVLDEKRIEDLSGYLRESSNNVIPGAVIVAVDGDHIHVTEVSDGLFSLSVDEDTRDFGTKLDELLGSFTTRLGPEELASAGIRFTTFASDREDDHSSDTFESSRLPEYHSQDTDLLDESVLPDPTPMREDAGEEIADDEDDGEATFPARWVTLKRPDAIACEVDIEPCSRSGGRRGM